MGIQTSGLSEEAMLLIRIGRQKAPDVVFDGVHAHGGMPLAKLGFRWRAFLLEVPKQLPRQVSLQSRQILQRTHLAKLGALLHMLQVKEPRCDLERASAFHGGIRARLQVEPAEHHLLGIHRFANLHHGGRC